MPNRIFLEPPAVKYLPPNQSDEVCFDRKVATDNGVWQEIDPFNIRVPVLIVQLIVVTGFTRSLLLACKRIRQPSFVAELLAGLLVSPSGIGSIPGIGEFFPERIFAVPRLTVLETLANLGLTYHLFLQGLEIDLRTISRIGTNSLSIGIAGALFSFTSGAIFHYIFDIDNSTQGFDFGCLYWGAALSVTGLPIVAEILAESKLIHSELGRIAVSSALVNDIISWLLLTIASAITSSHKKVYLPLLSALAIVAVSIFLIRPAVVWAIKQTRKREDDYNEATTGIILVMVLAYGLVTDYCGLNSMVGAFVFGLILPQQVLGDRFLLVVQAFVSEFFMPLYYATVGLRIDSETILIEDKGNVLLLVGVVWLSFLPKLVSTLAVSFFCKWPFPDGVSLAFLMNTKSLMAVMVLTLGLDHKALDRRGYLFMVITVLAMTMTTSPLTYYLHKPTKRFLPSKRRALQKLKPDAELRLLTCVHDLQTVPGITTLLRITNPTRRSPLCVFALQLIHLTRHTTALLIVQGSGTEGGRRADGQTDQMIAAFQKLEEENPLVSVYPLTAMSAYSTMHEDVCSIAEDKRVAFILLPFHKKQTIHNKMEEMNPAYKDVNDNVLANAPCSVGIFVDRGIGTSAVAIEEDDRRGQIFHHLQVAMIYIGGPDDREALAYASRMAGRPNINLTVLRFLLGENAMDIKRDDFMEAGNGVMMPMEVDFQNEKILDEQYVNQFRQKTPNNNSIKYIEKLSNNSAETVAALRSLDEKFDLFVVGRGLGMLSPLTAGLDDWSECPELGSIGDLLVTSDFSSASSVLVVQQYSGVNPAARDGTSTPDSSADGTPHASGEPFMRWKV